MADAPEVDDTSTALMQIGEVAERTELSIRSLRHWEDVGLLQPSHRTAGGFRLYTEADVDRILTIRRMKPLGFSLDEMRSTLADIAALHGPTDPSARSGALARLRDLHEDAERRRAKLARQVEMADEFLGLIARHTDPD